MTDQSKNKKRKVTAPVLPRKRTSKSPSVSRSRATSMSESGREQTPSAGKYVRAPTAYPTPVSADRLPAESRIKSRPKPISPLDLGILSAPRTGSGKIVSLSDSDDAEIIEDDDSPKGKSLAKEFGDNSDGSENEEVAGKGKARLEYDTGSDGVVGGEDNECDADADTEELDVEGVQGKALNSVRSKTPKASASNRGVKVKVEGADDEATKEQGEVARYNNKVLKTHVKNCVLRASKLEHAKDAGSLVPQFDASRRPVHFVNNIFIPHLDRKFDDEWNDWKERLLKVIRDPSQLDSQCPEWVLKAKEEDIRRAVKDGVFATMKNAWKKHQSGTGEKWLEERKGSSRMWGRRTTKASNRLTALRASGLNVKRLKYLCDPSYVSDEEDDPNVKDGRIIKVPLHRVDLVTELGGALDVAFDVNKAPQDGPDPESDSDDEASSKADKSDNKLEVPKWAVSAEWEAANPELEVKSRYFIDPEQTEIPDLNKIRAFIHRYTPKKRTYQDNLPISAPLAVDTSAPPAPNSAPVVSVVDPMANPATSQFEPIFTADAGENLLHTLTSVSDEYPTSAYNQPPALPTLRTSVEPRVSPSAPASLELQGPAAPPPGYPSNPNPSFQPSLMYAAQPDTQQPPPSQALGQPILVRTADGQDMWVYPCVAPPPQNPQDSGPKCMPMEFVDPALRIDESTRRTQWIDGTYTMPPPELLQSDKSTTQPPDVPEEAVELKRKRAPKGKGKGKEKKNTRRVKSKAVIEDEDEDEPVEQLSVAGPSSRLPSNGKGRSVKLNVRGL